VFHHPAEFVTFKTSPHLPGVELYSANIVDHTFAPHVHDAYSLGAIEAGAQRFRYKGSNHVAAAGTLVLLNPDELHDGHAEIATGWTYQTLYIDRSVLAEMTGSATFFSDATAHDPALAVHFKTLFRRMWQTPDDLAFVSDFTLLIDSVTRRYGSNPRSAPSIPERHPQRSRAMQRVRDCIEAHLDLTLHIDTLAAEAGMSIFHFVRTFSAQFHATPHQYLQARRAARAKTLLTQRATPCDAAAAVGLTDQSHLTRWFKRAYGVTPAQYQQQIGTRPLS
jgi:AraC-like DNA-binding protein